MLTNIWFRNWKRLFLLMMVIASESESANNYPCNIRKVYLESEESPHLIDVFPQEPVIFVGEASRNTVLAQAAGEKNLREFHGHTTVTLASSNSFSHDTIDMTLTDYLDLLDRNAHLSRKARANETYYLFGNNFSDLFKRLEKLYVLPPCRNCREAGAVAVGIGGWRSGVSFHFHGPGFAEVITGRKQFFLYPPDVNIEVDVPPNLTMSQWVDEYYPLLQRKLIQEQSIEGVNSDGIACSIDTNLSDAQFLNFVGNESKTSEKHCRYVKLFYECVLEPGNMLYFPDKWQHATLNLDNYNLFVSVFLDMQLLHVNESV